MVLATAAARSDVEISAVCTDLLDRSLVMLGILNFEFEFCG